MSTLTREPRNANATTLLITPTTLVCVGRGKFTSFVHYLEKDLGIENRFVDVEVLERSAERFFFLDLVQVAQASQDAVHWLRQRRCSIIAGCRIDGFDVRRLGGLFTALLMRYDGFAWDNQGYAVLAAPAATVGDILSRCDLPCLLQQELCASFEAVTLQPWPTSLEKRGQDHEFPLEPGVQLLPLSWSLDGQEVVCGLRNYVPTGERVRRRVLLVGSVTGQGELRPGLDLGVLHTSSAWKRVAGEEITIGSISPDGELLALVLASKTVLFDVVEQQVVRVIPTAGNPVLWSPDSSKIALCLTMHYDPGKATLENQVEIWDIFSHIRHPRLVYDGHHAEQFEQRVSEHLRTASWSPDGRLVVTAGTTTGMSATAHVWDAATGALRFVYRRHQERVTTVAFAPASSSDPLVASVGDDHTVQVWHALTGERVFHARSNNASFRKGWLHENHVAWSPDGQHIAFQTADDELAIAHVATGQVKSVCSLAPFALLDVAWSPDGQHISTLEVNFDAEEEDGPYCLCIRTVEERLC